MVESFLEIQMYAEEKQGERNNEVLCSKGKSGSGGTAEGCGGEETDGNQKSRYHTGSSG